MINKSHIILIAAMSSLFFGTNILAQGPLSFSADTVIIAACDSIPSPMGVLKVYNNTNNTITLNWEETNILFPFDGSTALIIDPIQFPPNATNGSSWVNANDSTDILFHIWPDSMAGGDTSLFQIVIYDPMDSLNTNKTLTAIVHCPLFLSIEEMKSEYSISVFPNPLHHESTILINNSHNDQFRLMIFNMEGKFIREVDLENGKATIKRKKP